MPASWIAWRKILSCRQDSPLAVFDPKANTNSITANTVLPSSNKPSNTAFKGHGVHHAKKRRSTSSSACCNDLKNVVHGNTRVVHRADHDSPLSHHHSSPRQLKLLIKREPSMLYSPRMDISGQAHKAAPLGLSVPAKKISSCYDCSISASCEPVDSQSSQGNSNYPKQKVTPCDNSISDMPDALAEHHATYHSLTELREGDSARSIVEIIFQTSWLRRDVASARPERIFKVHNSAKTIAKFEEYRDMVKTKASKISKKHSRCLVDGNELLRFHSTTISCHLGKMRTSTSSHVSSPSPSSLCTSSSCGVCCILRYGFPIKGQPGIYTNANSGQAHESIMFSKEYEKAANAKRAMLVCRVIAGRVKKTGCEISQDGPVNGYDSVAGEAGVYTDVEELVVFSNRAVLPCFVVVYSC